MKKKKILGLFFAFAAVIGIAACTDDNIESSIIPSETSEVAGSSVAPTPSSTEEVPSTSSTPSSTEEVPSTNPTPSSEPTPTTSTPDPDKDPVVVLEQDFSSEMTIGEKPTEPKHGDVYLSGATGTATIEGDTRYAKATGVSGDTSIFIALEGLDNGKIFIEFDFALGGGAQNSWTFFQMNGYADRFDSGKDEEVFAFRTYEEKNPTTKHIGYRVDKAEQLKFAEGLTYSANIMDWFHASLEFDLDTAEGRVTLTNPSDVVVTNTFTDEFNEIIALKFMAKSGKTTGVDNIKVTHVEGDFAANKVKKEENFKKFYADIDLAGYVTNGAALTAAYDIALAAIQASTDFSTLNSAYITGLAAMKACKSDAEIKADELKAAIEVATNTLNDKFDELLDTRFYTETELVDLRDLLNQSIASIELVDKIENLEVMVTTAIDLLNDAPHTGTGENPDLPMDYTFDAALLTAAIDNEVVTQDEMGTIVKITGTNVVKRISKSSGKVQAIELGKGFAGALTIECTKDCTLTLTIGSTGGSNTSTLGLYLDNELFAPDSVGGEVTEVDGLLSVYGTGYPSNTVTYTLTKGQTYIIQSAATDRGFRIKTINIV